MIFSKSFTGRDVTNTILKRFEDQRMRGTTSFGFYLPQQNRLTHHVKESRIKTLLKRTKGDNSEVLFHHRFSTSTVDVRNACHPFSTKDAFEYQYIGAHNGVLHNEDKLQKEHEERGITYVSTQENGSFNDSEALVYDLARYFEGEIDEMHAEGSIAFIVVKRDKTGKPLNLFFGHNNGNPLKMKKTKNSLTISSEGEGELIPVNQLHIFDYETGEIRTKYMYIPSQFSNYSYTYKNGEGYTRDYSHWDGSYDDYADDGWRYKQEVDSAKKFNNMMGFSEDDEDIVYEMREGSAVSIKQQFMEENYGRLSGAALSAELEYELCSEEIKSLDALMMSDLGNDELEAIAAYWERLKTYGEILVKISIELYVEAKQEEEKEVKKADEAFGFHSTKQSALSLPSTVIKNNNAKSIA